MLAEKLGAIASEDPFQLDENEENDNQDFDNVILPPQPLNQAPIPLQPGDAQTPVIQEPHDVASPTSYVINDNDA